MAKRSGRFLVLEGADGSGKTTQAATLVGRLQQRGFEVLHLRDPGSTRLAEAVRAILLDPSQGAVDPAAEACLYFAARAQLASEVIAPALARGGVVLCERWTPSTEVYQGVAGGFGASRVRAMERAVVPGVKPDLVAVLDVRLGEGLARIGWRGLDRIESKGRKFHDRVVRAYRAIAKRPRHVLVPHGPPERVAAALAKLVEERL